RNWKWEVKPEEPVDGLIFPTSGAGVLYPPNVFHKDVTDTRLSMELCPDTDDVWLYWMASLGGAKIKRASQALQLIEWPNKNGDQLWKDNILQGKNDFNIKKMIDAYGAPWNDSVSKSKFSVAEYWDDRYKAGGNSGAGSYGRL